MKRALIPGLALLTSLSFIIPFAHADELMKWERIPLQVPLHIDRERIVFVNKNVRVGFPPELNGKLRVQSSGGAVYLKASGAFPVTRLQLQNVENGELILLDVSATAGKEAMEAVRLVYSGEVSSATASSETHVSGDVPVREAETSAPKTDKNKKPAVPYPVALTRYAAQNLYAPLRTVEPLPGVRAQALRLPKALNSLLPGEPVTVAPLVSWAVGGYSVVVLRVKNQRSGNVVLDPRALQGRFYSAAFQHRWIGPAGTPEDTTVLYLITEGKPEAAFYSEAATPLRKKRGAKREN